MTYRTLILSIFLIISCTRIFSQENIDARLRKHVTTYGQAEVAINWPGQIKFDYLNRNFSISSFKNNVVRIKLPPSRIELFIQQGFKYRIEEEAEIKTLKTASGIKEAKQWDSYPTYSQYLEIMKGFAEQYPSLCRLDTIGVSIYGKLVLALKISDFAGIDESEPEVFYTSSMHGDETGGFILMLRFADYLLKNYQSDGRVRNMVDNLGIWINPLANPDGTYRVGDVMTYPTRFNANEVDLNRNFPDPLQPYGNMNIQQKETADMVKFLGKHRFVLSANFHSGSEVVNYPWDAYGNNKIRIRNILHADNDWFHQISREYADTVHKFSGPYYMADFENGIVRGAEWYIIFGGRQDFVTWELQGREVTIELDNTYKTPADRLETLWQNNYRSLMGYLENALYGIHGNVSDDKNSKPVAARIFIKGHDKDSSHVYSDTLSGFFVRMLSPGSYDLTFNAFGYRDTTVTDVSVSRFGKTDLDVRMAPVNGSSQLYPVLYPNPSRSDIKAILPNYYQGKMNIRIYGSTGLLYQNYNIEAASNKQLTINTSVLPSGVYTVVFTLSDSNISLKGRFIVVR